MLRFAHCFLVLIGLIVGFAGGGAEAQDNRDAGKKPAELFAADCSGCHKSPAGLAKSPGMFGLESFLREHYTASKQSAALIAGYLRSVDAEQPATGVQRRKSEPKPKAAGKPAADAKKPDEKAGAKPGSEKPAEPKPADSKPPESRPAETKPPAEIPTPAATQEKSN